MTTNTIPVRLSAWEHDLYEHLTEHMEAERHLVGRYEDLASHCGGPRRILAAADHGGREARHHRLFEEWRNALQSNAEFRDVVPRVPHMRRSTDAEKVRTAAGREFLEVERANSVTFTVSRSH